MTGLFLGLVVVFGTLSGSASETNASFDHDGQLIIAEIGKKFEAFKARGYQLPPGAFPMLMASWVFDDAEIDAKTMAITWQHDTRFFVSIGQFIEKHVCQTPTGAQLCRIYFKKINEQTTVLKSDTIAETIAKFMILAVSEDPKALDAWSSNYIMWLFVQPKKITTESLTRRIVHEMFQAVDIKNSILGVMEAAKGLPENTVCGLAAGNLNKAVRFASSAIRAYKVEDAILQEISGHDLETTTVVPKQSCLDNLKWAHKQMHIFNSKTTNLLYVQQVYGIETGCYNSNMREAIDEKSGMAFGARHFGQNVDQCEFLTTPNLDQIEKLNFQMGTLDAWIHGPRPRIGGD